ncbi:hypothetical protein IOD16_34765 [Saccharothrix sp. 6-C]|uniref:hypothetical protein n=1 Tax=Saccharothrix sp. 6-C TaxID=2781735 RepID=UPI0019178999|nr:hypothetical protein [Saccharothrix sp. 6-C]QQQ76142.1 hypothetical protein IOD16_34765 [Saccharothrix sp. 6-C]
MATPDAVRLGGSLLLRTLAVSGLAAAAWFVCAGVATAGEDHPDEAAKTLDSVNVAIDAQQAAAADLIASAVPADAAPFTTVAVMPQPAEPPSLVGVALPGLASRPAVLPVAPEPEPDADRDEEPYPESTADGLGHTGGYSHSGGYSSGYRYSGAVSNTMPVPLYEAKVAEKAAARAVAVDAPRPVPLPVVVPVRGNDQPVPTASPSPAVSQVAPDAEVIWEAPAPNAPAPTPKQAPAPSAPTASSGGADSGGGGHRGGVTASLTGQADPKPLAAWSAEQWDDGRSPGSVPGLPSTSPD